MHAVLYCFTKEGENSLCYDSSTLICTLLRHVYPGTDPLDMEAMLTFPSGKSDLCEIKDMPHSLYDIRFTPEEEGVHTVSLKHKGLHIAGL